jgi:hypothetical protein
MLRAIELRYALGTHCRTTNCGANKGAHGGQYDSTLDPLLFAASQISDGLLVELQLFQLDPAFSLNRCVFFLRYHRRVPYLLLRPAGSQQ